MNKETIKKLVPTRIWNSVRTMSIIHKHTKVAGLCNHLISSYFAGIREIEMPGTKRIFPKGTKIIWQYWAQGFENLPVVVAECFASVDKYAGEYQIIRLSDTTIQDYLDIPDFVLKKKDLYGLTHFSDLLRLMLLNTYGGIWIDATIMLSGPIPNEYYTKEFFAFQRDPEEAHKDYWENTYAYYFSWAKGFRVKLLTSFIIAGKGDEVISALCGCMLKWWKENDSLPDYFFFQILFDVLIEGELKGRGCPIVSDCLPHYLQQFRNDPDFFIKSEKDIFRLTTIHKLTYK